MPGPPRNFADAETLLVDWLKSAPRSWVNVSTELPTNLAGVLANGPYIRVNRFGGADTHPGLDVAHIAIDVWAIGRDATKTAAETIRRSIVLDLRGTTVAGVAISRVATIAAPTVRPFDSASIRQVGASYQITLHRSI